MLFSFRRHNRCVTRFRPGLEALEDRAVPATLTVNTPLDVLGHDGGMLSLRQAILDANTSAGADTIVLPAGTYALTRAGADEDAGLTGDLDISGKLTIRGAGETTVDAAGLDRVFHVLAGGDVNLSGLSIRGGQVAGFGGGVYNGGTLTIRDSVLSGNFADTAGGGIFADLAAATKLHNSTISGNFTNGSGGGIYASFDTSTAVEKSTLSGNSASGGDGGGLFTFGTLTVRHSAVVGNTAYYSGGGVYSGGESLIVSDSTISDNSSGPLGNGGGINFGAGTATLTNSILSGNSAANYGGGIYSSSSSNQTLAIRACTISGNSAVSGGGIFNESGTVTVWESALSGNSALLSGGGIDNESGTLTVNHSTLSGNSTMNFGGGIYNSSGTVTVNDSTLSGNSAFQGGAIYNTGVYADGTVTVRDSILAGNVAVQLIGEPVSEVGGGAIYNVTFEGFASATMTVSNCTLSGNTATDFGGGIANFGALTVRDSEVIDNSAPLGGDLYNLGTVTISDSTVGDIFP